MVTRAIFLIGKSGFIPSSETTQLMGNVRKMRKLHLREVQVLFNQIEKLGLFRYFLNTCDCGSQMSKYSTREYLDTRF